MPILPPQETIVGVKVLVPGVNPEVDIVAVHGLGGHPYRTWTALGEENRGKKDVEWLKELLPKEVPNARILSYGYDSDPAKLFDKGPASTNTILDHAKSLVTTLHYFRKRPKENKRPIIFICHSLGGIVVKRALIYSAGCNLSHNSQFRSIKVSTHGIIFMGTPHAGSELAKWGKTAEKLIRMTVPKKWIESNSKLIKALEANSETLLNITDNFLGISSDFRLFFFYEELKTDITGVGFEMVVERSSAVPMGLPNVGQAAIHANHSKMCKFYDADSPGWDTFRGVITDFVSTAPLWTALRWRQEKRREEVAQLEQREEYILQIKSGLEGEHYEQNPSIAVPGNDPALRIGGGRGSPLHPDEIESVGEASRPASIVQIPYQKVPPLVKTLSLRENDYFEGRKFEMDAMHKILHDPKKRVICITSVTGGGKTHLARQYFFTRESEFPGGRFWIDCKPANIKTALDLGYCKIAEDLHLPVQRNEDLSASSSSISEDFSNIKPVADWFEHNEKWLLVLDGVDIISEKDRQILSKYVPKGKRGSIIITTLNSSLAGAARIGSPERLELGKMKDEEAVRMLLYYAQKKHITEKEQKAAEKLVKALGNLPLAIHSAGSYIKSSKMPISEYLKTYKRAPFDLEPVDMILNRVEEHHPEAYNLLRILAFIHREIPVQMLLWGIKRVRREVELLAKIDGRRDFNNTIANLITYSLLDRTPVEDGQQPGQLQVDTLMFHSVIQASCITRMSKRPGELEKWLQFAIDVFGGSFDKVNLGRKDAEFLVSDYRRYEVHGERLLEFANKYKSPSAVYVKESLEIIREAISENGGSNTDPNLRKSMFASPSLESAPDTPSSHTSAWINIDDHNPERSESLTKLNRGEASPPTPKPVMAKEKGKSSLEDTSRDSDINQNRARRPITVFARRPRWKFRRFPRVEKHRSARSGISGTNSPKPFSASSSITSKKSLEAFVGNSLASRQTKSTEKKRRSTTPVKRPHSPNYTLSPHSSQKTSYQSANNASDVSGTGLQLAADATSSPVDYKGPQPAFSRGRSPLRSEIHRDIGDISPQPVQQTFPQPGPEMYRHQYRSGSVPPNTSYDFERVGNGSADFKIYQPHIAEYPPYDSTASHHDHSLDEQSYHQDNHYDLAWLDTVRSASMFDPGYVPPMDMANTPIARSIVAPRGRYRPPSIAYSEPIKEFATPFSPGVSTPLGPHGMHASTHSHFGGSGIAHPRAASSRSASPYGLGASPHAMSRQVSGGSGSGAGSHICPDSPSYRRSRSNSNYSGTYQQPSPYLNSATPSSEPMTRNVSDNAWRDSPTVVNSPFNSPPLTQVDDNQDWCRDLRRSSLYSHINEDGTWTDTSQDTPVPTGLGIVSPPIPSFNFAPITPDVHSQSDRFFTSGRVPGQDGLVEGLQGLGISQGYPVYYPAHYMQPTRLGGLSTPRATPRTMGGVEMERARSEPGLSAYLFPPPHTNIPHVDGGDPSKKRRGSQG